MRAPLPSRRLPIAVAALAAPTVLVLAIAALVGRAFLRRQGLVK